MRETGKSISRFYDTLDPIQRMELFVDDDIEVDILAMFKKPIEEMPLYISDDNAVRRAVAAYRLEEGI